MRSVRLTDPKSKAMRLTDDLSDSLNSMISTCCLVCSMFLMALYPYKSTIPNMMVAATIATISPMIWPVRFMMLPLWFVFSLLGEQEVKWLMF